MSYYIRKIRTEQNVEFFRLSTDISSIEADVITEFNISNGGDLSVWKIDNYKDYETVNKIIVAIAICFNKCEDTSFLLLSDKILRKYDIPEPQQESSGNNYCEEIEKLHYNIKRLVFRDISKCLSMYREIIKNDDTGSPVNIIYIPGNELAKLIMMAKKDNLFEKERIKCLSFIKKKYKEIYNELDN